MAAKVAVVIPVYKEALNIFEKISLTQVKKVLGKKYPIIFVTPENKIFSYFSRGDTVTYFSAQFFQSTQTYNVLMVSAGFYKAFYEYDYILIYQLDAFVFSDKLEYFCNLGYDNIGAPWFIDLVGNFKIDDKILKTRVGNGGFCLRKVKACYDLLTNHPDWVESWIEQKKPEDVFFSVYGMVEGSNFRTAPINIAYQFSMEHFPERCVKKNGGELPFGCHAWHNMDPEFYIETFLKFGYDLRPFRNQLRGNEKAYQTGWLIKVAFDRLKKRLTESQSLTRYLPQKNFASIRVVRHPFTMLLLTRLLLENPGLSDKIFFYDETELDILTHDCRPEKLPHLLLAMGGGIENLLIESFNNNGLAYGSRVVSFQREYLSYCEKLFHNLGK